MPVMDFSDPLESLPGGDLQMPSGNLVPRGGSSSSGVDLKLTPAGIRAILGRKVCRSKPFLELTCSGCGRTTFSKCRFIPADIIEWCPGYYKLTSRMRDLGITEPQPSGDLCADCHHTMRRGYPDLTRAQLVSMLKAPTFRAKFRTSLELYWSDVEEKISLGNARIKKRKKAVTQEKETALEVSVPGMFVELNQYEEDFGKPEDNHHTVHKVHHPMENKDVDAVFIPKHKPGYFEGALRATKKVKLAETMDDNTSALEDNQVHKSFDSNAACFSKSMPSLMPGADTYKALLQKAAEPEGEEAETEENQEPTRTTRAETAGTEDVEDADEEELLQLSVAIQSREDERSRTPQVLTEDALESHNHVMDAAVGTLSASHRGDGLDGLGGLDPPPIKKQKKEAVPKRNAAPAGGSVAAEAAASSAPPPPAAEVVLEEGGPDAQWLSFLQAGWKKCISVNGLGLDCKEGSAGSSMISGAPKDLEVDKGKWEASMASFSTQFLDFQKLLLGDSKLKDQEIKSLATALKKGAVPKAKKAGLKTTPNVMVDRIKGLAEVALQVKTFRSELVSTKSKVLSADDVKASIDKMSELWQKVPMNEIVTHVSCPELWVQAWVGNAVSKQISDLSDAQKEMRHDTDPEELSLPGSVKEALATLKHSIFFGPPDVLQAQSAPNIKHAYGKFNDFFYFTKFVRLEDIKTLQCKLLGNALAQILADRDGVVTACLQLISFLPESDMDKRVLCPEVGKTMYVLYDLAYAVQSISLQAPCVGYDGCKQLLEKVDCLKPGNVTKVSKQLARFAGCPVLKQIQRKLHVFFSQLEVDEAAGRRASMLKDHMASVDLVLATGKEVTVSLMQVTNHCKLFQQLVKCLAAVPASPESQHAELRERGLEARARLEDRILENFVSGFGRLFSTPDLDSGSELARDAAEFSVAFDSSKDLISSCAVLGSDLRALVNQLAAVSQMVSFQVKADGFLEGLQQSDAMPCPDSGAPSESCRTALAFVRNTVASYTLLGMDGPCKSLPEGTFENFQKWVEAEKTLARKTMAHFQELLISSYGLKFQKPDAGWGDDQLVLEKLLREISTTIKHFNSFEFPGGPQSDALKKLLTTKQDIEKSLDVGLTQEEKNLKATMDAALEACVKEYPSFSHTELMKADLDTLEKEVAPKKIATSATKFFEVMKESRAVHQVQLQNLGQAFLASIDENEAYLKAVLATQSGLAVVRSGDQARACGFEERLAGRSLSFDQIPDSLKTAITAMMKKP